MVRHVPAGAHPIGTAAAVLLVALLFLVSPGLPRATGPGSSNGAGVVSSSLPGPGAVIVAPAYRPPPGVADLGPLPHSEPLDVLVGLAPSDPAGLDARLALEYTPGAPEYRNFLTPSQVVAQYGPSTDAYARAVGYFAGLGLNVTPSPDRLLLEVRGPADRIGAAFHTTFEAYHAGPRAFFSHPVAATLPSGIPWSGVLGLGNSTPMRPMTGAAPLLGPVRSLAGCPNATGSLVPCQVQAGYNLSATLAAGTNGSGYRIGVVDVYDSSEPQATLASDFKAFTTAYGLPGSNVSWMYPVPTTRNLNSSPSSGWGTEEALDVEWARALAPGAAIDFAFAPDPTTGLYAAVDWMVAHHAVDELSLSWGEPDLGVYNAYSGPCALQCNASSDGSYTLLHPVLVDAAAEGIGVFVASGDCGAADGTSGVSTDYPSSDPAATGVGATNLLLNGSNGWTSETAWSGNASGAASPGCQNQGGSGGGFAPFPRPWWQSAPGLRATPAGRGVPDVAIVGGDQSPLAFVVHGFTSAVWGTSASTPQWAGLAAVADSVAHSALGFLDPALYALARGPGYSAQFHDIVSGSNGYAAGAGWDPVTGLGSPNAGRLLPALSGGLRPPTNLTLRLFATPRLGPLPLTVNFTTNLSNASVGTPVYDVSFGDGNASFAPGGRVTHTFRHAGVFEAVATVIDAAGNSTVAPPVAVVVGGGAALNVSLNVSQNRPSAGALVNLTATVTGGLPGYHYWFAFGDGTYLNDVAQATTRHAYGAAGGYCATVVVRDASAPPNGGTSESVAVGVGGATPPACGYPALRLTLSAPVVAGDLPGDFPVVANSSGGGGPVTVQLTSDDAYARACGCPIFRSVGPHVLTAFANDSVDQGTVARLNVTLYPALLARFNASTLSGPAPLTVDFASTVSGGHNASANSTRWTFGDGSNATGPTQAHTYTTPGTFLAFGAVADGFGGHASEAFLVDVVPSGSPPSVVTTANVTPATDGYAGSVVNFTSSTSGPGGPFTTLWGLGAGGSAYGASVQQSYAKSGCLGNGTCPLDVTLRVYDAAGGLVRNLTLPLQPLLSLRWSALVLTDAFAPTFGTTPLWVSGHASALGMPGASVAWTFGDGGTATGPYGNHTYLTPGNFTVTEVATDPSGDRLVRTHAVPVVGLPRLPPVVRANATPLEGIGPLTVAFTSSASGGAGGPYQVNWSFGDGTTGSGADVNHTYRAAGGYSAVVTAIDRIGSPGTATLTVRVFNLTQVTLTVAPGSPRVPAGSPLAVAIRVAPACTNQSVPACSAGAVPLAVGFVPVGGVAGTMVRVPAGASGWANTTVTAPSAPGAYWVEAVALGPNFTGSARGSVAVDPAAPTATILSPLVALGGSAAAGAAVGALALWVGRRPRRSTERDG